MKFFATLAISALAVVSAADVPACDPSLISLASGPDGMACTKATGYSAATLKVPVGDVLAKVCMDPSCQKLMAAVNKAVPTECSLGGVPVKATLLDKIPAACEAAKKAAGGAGAANATAAANATTPANATKPETTTKVPTATTVAPVDKTEKPGSSDKMEEVEITTGSSSMAMENPVADKTTTTVPTTVPTPSPTKTSGAAAVVAASSALVVAIAATLV